jgi:site-specific DNA-methyltransferase (adenine-specific)
MTSYTINFDANRVLPEYPDFAFDLGIHDPPYFKGPNKRKYYGSKVSTTGIARPLYNTIDTWELPTLEWFNQVQRTCRYWIIWGANYYDFIGKPFATPRREKLAEFIAVHPTGWIVWDKCNGNTSFNDFELAYTNLPIETTVYRYMWNGMMQGKSVNEGHIMRGDKRKNEKRIHPTQKPVPLYLWLYREFAKPGYKILDCYLGSGSSRIAADMMDLDFTGIEINTPIFNLQERRYSEYKQQ